ncbi:MAG: hypothetical protein KA792_00750 [Bacteroidales bacterium]|nr:hypothetical protein [Bacteroidales bacterium]
MVLTQNIIDELITCQKRINKMPVEWKQDKGHFKVDFELQSLDEQYYFSAFGRYNEKFNENFSFGLVYLPKHIKGSYELIRCNGPHGEHHQFPHHIHYHIHKATQKNIEKGLKEDCTIEITTEYTNFDEAFHFFARHINIIQDDINILFPPKQTSLFD